MRTWKLVSGIISIMLCLFVMFQSCAVGIGNTLSNNGEVSGFTGFIVSVMLFVGGIVSIDNRNKNAKGENIAMIVLYGIGALLGFMLAGSYSDLIIWAMWCLVCAGLAALSIVNKDIEELKREPKKKPSQRKFEEDDEGK